MTPDASTLPDLSACEREPIQFPGAVQAHGVLLSLRTPALTVTRVSANCTRLLGHRPEALLGLPLAQALDADLAAAVRSAHERWRAAPSQPASFRWRDPSRTDDAARSCWCSVHRSADALVLELEPEPQDRTPAEADAVRHQAMAGMAAVRAEQGLDAKLAAAAGLLRTLTGYDRVMIYRLDQIEWHGEVIAESRITACEPYLGLRYPASDIPSQARALYLSSPTRIIADIDQSPVPLLSAPDDRDAAPLDLSLSTLRAVSPVHIEYLHNMGVRATLTGSLVCNGGLWGLVACHHYGPRRLPGWLRELTGWLAQDLSDQIALSEARRAERHRTRLKACRERVIAGMRAGHGLADLIQGPQLDDVLGAVAAEGVALVGAGRVVTGGATPSPVRCADLAARLAERAASPGARLFATDCLSHHLPGTEDVADTAAAVLLQPLAAGSEMQMLCFRGELLRRVTWGGNPEKAVIAKADGRISPRKSFAAWQEIVRLHGPRWLDEELDSAREFGVLIDIETRLRAEQAMRDYQARFRSMMDNSPAVVFIKDMDGRYLLVNRRCEALLGKTDAELRGKRPDEVLPPAMAAEFMANDRAVIDSLQTQTVEETIPCPGGVRRMLSTQFPLLDAEGRPSGIAGISLDITERRQAEHSRDTALAKYRALFEHFPLGITVCDRDGAIVEANRASEQMLGVSLAEHTGRAIDGPEWSIERPEGGPLPASEYASVRACKERKLVRDQEMVLVAPMGERRWLNVSAAPLEVEGLGALVVYEDVSERKRFEARRREEAALRESERRFRLMADELPVLIWVNDADNNCTMVNKTYSEYVGLPESACTGQQWYELVHPQDRERYCNAVLDKVRLRQPFHGCCRARRADGAWRWMESFARPLLDSEGRFQGVVGTTLDVTERKAAEDALQESHRTLQQHADQLGRLTAALTLAEQRERERLAKVLHDHLQQLLVGASLGVERLSRQLAAAGADQAGQPGRGGVDAALASLKDLLRQSIEATRTLVADLGPPILHDVGLGAALEWLARNMADNHGLEVDLVVETQIRPQPPEVRSVLFECVREALFNVVKHAGSGRAEVRVHRDDCGLLCVEITDQGAGFDAARVRAGESDGTGFGILAMRERLRCLGGLCEIDSHPGAGTHVLLRAPPGPQPEAKPTAGGTVPPARQPGLGNGPAEPEPGERVSVLLVDDHAMMRQGLRALLAEEPTLEVVGEACDGVEALDLVARLRPRLVLMDYSMPRMDGLTATREIRSRYPDVCIIALSMYREADRAEAMLAAGASAYVDKTAGADALLQAVRGQLPHCPSAPGRPPNGAARQAED
jgi:PAS domain S-box-containing protein